MKEPALMAASIERFRLGFWGRQRTDHPPVGVVPERTWLPIGYLRTPLERAYVRPADIAAGLARSDYEDASIGRTVFSDDWLPYNAAWRAVPWLEAMAGCRVRAAAGSLAAEACAGSLDELAAWPLPAACDWYEQLAEQTAAIAAELPADCFASPTILRGPSDVLAAMRGLSNFYLDLVDDPAAVARAAERVNRLFLDVLLRHFALVPPKLGGYGHIYGYWAPAPSNVLQEDVLGMVNPRLYRDIFMPLNAQIVRRLGAYTMFHLHSTGMRHWADVLAVPGMAGLEITVEANGPALGDLAPILRTILERTRLMLFVDAWFEDLPDLLRQVPHEGLYLIVSDKFIAGEASYQAFIKENFGSRPQSARIT